MGRFEGLFLATDLDGTLLTYDKRISDENADAIRYFQSEGGIFTVATGRYPEFLKSYSDSFCPNECVIALNGNMIYDLSSHRTVHVSRMNKTSVKVLLDYALKNFDNIDFINVNDDVESYTYKDSLKRDMCKCLIFTKDADTAERLRDDLRIRFGNLYKIVRSWASGLEIYDKNSGKGECVEYIKENINPHIRKTICVGDYENDISMLELADIGYAVKNAAREAKNAADKITDVDNDNHAIAWVIEDIQKEGI